MPPGITRHWPASITFFASLPSEPAGATAAIVSPSTATSLASVPVGVTTVPLTTSRSYIRFSLSQHRNVCCWGAGPPPATPPPTGRSTAERRHLLRREALDEMLLALGDLEDDERPVSGDIALRP